MLNPRLQSCLEPQSKGLKRWTNGEAVVAQDRQGYYRYVYSDGSLDKASVVDFRNPVVRAFIVQDVLLISLPEEVTTVEHDRLRMIHNCLEQTDLNPEVAQTNLHHLGFVARVAASGHL